MENKNVKIVNKNGELYLLHPGVSPLKVDGNIQDAWAKLEKEIENNRSFFVAAGVEEEFGQFQIKRAFEKNFWLENLIKGSIFAIPVFVAFLLFAFVLTNQVKKLTTKMAEGLSPSQQIKNPQDFARTLEVYRPYLRETLRVWEEEKALAEASRRKNP